MEDTVGELGETSLLGLQGLGLGKRDEETRMRPDLQAPVLMSMRVDQQEPLMHAHSEPAGCCSDEVLAPADFFPQVPAHEGEPSLLTFWVPLPSGKRSCMVCPWVGGIHCPIWEWPWSPRWPERRAPAISPMPSHVEEETLVQVSKKAEKTDAWVY